MPMPFIRKNKLSAALRFCLLLIAATICHAHADAYPLVRNYNRAAYNAGTQNWEIGQDAFGRMLFANNTGLLVYDSRSWSLHYLSNFTTVRSVYVEEKTGRIYVGGSEEFGYFTTSENEGRGEPAYVSLTGTIQSSTHHFSEIWNIHQAGKYIYFQSDFCIFRYDGKKTVAIPYQHKITTSAFVKERMLIASKEGGVSILNGNKFTPLPGNELLVGKKVVAIIPYSKSDILLVTELSGIFRYDGTVITPFPTDIDGFLEENQVFCAATNERELVFGTVNNGIVIKDIASGSNTYVNTKTGMQNNTVLSIYFDKFDNIWLGLDNGIDYVLYNSPISTLFGSNMYGAGYASMLRNGTLYLGTNQGLYSTTYPTKASPNPVGLSPLMKGQVWSIDTIGSTIFSSNDRGLFTIHGGQPRQIEGIPGSWSVTPLKKHKGYALVSTYESFFLIKEVDGEWVLANKVDGYNESGGRIIEDEFGDIWISHWMKGVFRLHLSSDLKRFDRVSLYNHKKGFPTDRNNTLYLIDNQMSFSTEGGFYRYDRQHDQMTPDRRLNDLLGARTSVRLYQSPTKDVWGVSAKFICAAFYNASGTYNIDSITYKPMLDRLIVGFENFNFTSPRKLIVSSEDGFFEIDMDREHRTNWSGHLFVNNIYATGLPKDSVIYTIGQKTEGKELSLPYKLNSLKFEFIYPEYREEGAVQYSYYLENYDSGWSAYSPTNSKEYTQLKEGSYTLHIRSFNRYDERRSETTFRFHIAPPWYRSLWANAIYVVLIIASGSYAYKFLQKKSHNAAIAVMKRKEAELAEFKRKTEEETLRKENEIAHLKSEQLEHDIKHKSQELSNATMNVIRKNEILIDIYDQISKMQEDSKSSFNAATIKQINKIQRQIKENISHDDDWQKFAQNFDIVYENYLKRLIAKHPQLSTNDQRLCAYLKMGLSSKEIAPLLNMSYRSVEMTRYRLRKKMELSRDVNLVDYLQRI